MELCVEFWLMSIGCVIGYGSPHTLTDTGVKLKAGCRHVACMSLISRPLHVACVVSWIVGARMSHEC